jgi:prefoldin alpha subunit
LFSLTLVDLKDLGPQQLVDIKQQLEQEIQHLSDSFSKLKQAQAKFRECIDTVDKTSAKENDEKPILVPLTSSLYVPGKIADIDTYMVDVGTGYFVEKVSYILPRYSVD